MRYLSTVALLATLTSGILAQSVGTFEAFQDYECSEEGQVITVENPQARGEIIPPATSVRSHLQDCILIVWDDSGRPNTIYPGDAQCRVIPDLGIEWEVQCPEE